MGYFPATFIQTSPEIEEQQKRVSKMFDSIPYNRIEGKGKYGIASGGATYPIVKDIIEKFDLDIALLKVGAVFQRCNAAA